MSRFRSLMLIASLLAGSQTAFAQSAAGPSATNAEVILNQAPPPPPPVASVAAPLIGQQHDFGAQLQFGFPSGLRLQYAAFRYNQTALLAEAFVGGRTAFWGNEGVFGLGGRSLFTLATDGEKNALLFGPGLHFNYWQAGGHHHRYDDWDGYRRETDQTYLQFDASISWLHEISPALGWELGLNAGTLLGLTGRESCGCKVGGKFSGMTLGIFTGLRF